MILYKYLKLQAAMDMLKASTLGFSQTWALNDPTEATAASYNGEPHGPQQGMFPRGYFINQGYATSCLTRTALNAIMWAHYADSHMGLVVGIDTLEAGLENIDAYTIPAMFGSVIYTTSKPTHQYPGSEDMILHHGKLHSFNPEYLAALQRTFLYKSTQWAYEEEVRIVKSITSFAQGTRMIPHRRHEWVGTFLQPIRREAIKSIHFGRSMLPLDAQEGFQILKDISKYAPDADLYQVQFKSDSWEMDSKPVRDWKRHYREVYYPDTDQ